MLSAWNSVPLGNDFFGRLMLSQILSIFLSFYFKVMWDEWGGLWHNVRGSAMDFNRLLIHWRHLYYICAEWWGLARGPPGASQPCHLLATLYLLENDKIPELAQFWGFPFSGKHLSLCACLKMMKSLNLVNLGISIFRQTLATLWLLENDEIPKLGKLGKFWDFPFSGKHKSASVHCFSLHLLCETCVRLSSVSRQLHSFLKGAFRQTMPSSKPVETVISKLKDLAE